MHVNQIALTPPLSQIVLGNLFPSLVLDDEAYGKFLPSWDLLVYALVEFGYFHLQATKPDTVGKFV